VITIGIDPPKGARLVKPETWWDCGSRTSIRILKPIPLLFRQQGAGPPQGGLGISGLWLIQESRPHVGSTTARITRRSGQ